MTSKKYYDVIDCGEWKDEEIKRALEGKGGDFHIKGHGLDDTKAINSIKEEIDEDYDISDDGEFDIKILRFEKKEIAYTCSRYFEGEDARNEGHNYWIDYVPTWRKGLAKVTTYTVWAEKVKKGDSQ